MSKQRPADRLNRLWGAVVASFGAFFALWGLAWLDANILLADLQNRCPDLRRGSFPPEKACRYEDGTSEGVNSAWFESLFYLSLLLGVALLVIVLALEAGRKSRA